MIIVLGLSCLENQIYTKMFVFDTVGVWNCNSVRVTKRPPKADYTKDHGGHEERRRGPRYYEMGVEMIRERKVHKELPAAI